ncbi:MAG: aldehyde dehydrogenase EutE, partial [Bacillota bacterium]
VDNTADIAQAARDIVDGASFDNNVLCIAEKEVFVLDDVAGLLVDNMVKHGCYLADESETAEIMETVLEKDPEEGYVPNKGFVGKDASYILEESGIKPGKEYRLVITEVAEAHPFVQTEMLMPVLPIVRVSSIGAAISKAKRAEGSNYHTAIMHSENVTNMSKAAKSLNTTVFVKNAPSYAGLGLGGEGFTTLTIATPTGEGLTSARSFTRRRRCTLAGAFRIT